MQDVGKDAKIAKLRSLGRCEFWSYAECKDNSKPIEVRAEVWLKEQQPSVRAKFISRWAVLRQQDGMNWRRPIYDNLSKKCKGLGEIRFEVLKVQYRPLGYMESKKFTIVFFATEKSGKFIPANACETGLKLKNSIQSRNSLSQEMSLELLP